MPFGTILKAALIAGLAAGLTVAVFHALATEPVIDRAIAIEEQREAAAGEHEEPMVSRQAQKVGLVVGYVVYGLTWALLFGSAFSLAQRWLPDLDGKQVKLLAPVAAYWAVGLLPFLKYPANPPAVGDPETIAYRQGLYLGFLALSVVGVVLAIVLANRLRRSGGLAGGRRALPLAFLLAYSAILVLAMPPNPDAIEMPAELVAAFRGLSLAGITIFWAVLGLLFGLLLTSPARPAPAPGRAY